MNFKTLILPVVLVAAAFIGFGDHFLPNPLNTLSFNTRNAISQTIMGATPQLKPQKPDAATEKAVDNISH
jgi:hypothetical protein